MKINVLQKRMLSALTALALILTAMPVFSAAQEECVISTAEELIAIAYSTDKADFSKNYRLLGDIDMSLSKDVRAMKAIGQYSGGSDDIAFNGTFDGDGHTISNLSTSGEALFGYVGEQGVIKNLTLKNASVHYMENSSSKYPAALVSLNYGEITSCFSVNSTVVSDYCSPAGGFAGTNFGSIRRCGVQGGSVSFAVSKTGTSHGGFVGNQRGGVIEECFSTAAVDAKKWAGGFAGKIEDGIISDCYARGAVNGSEENGGFAGAFLNSAVLRNVYAANDVTALSGGGIAGGKGFSFAEAGIPENCWYCGDFSLPQNSESFNNSENLSKSSDAMRTADFAAQLSDKWAYDENINDGYPYLINVIPPVTETDSVTAEVKLAGYDKERHEFYPLAEVFAVTLHKDAVTVKDILSAAAENNDISCEFGSGAHSGQVVTINGVTPVSPDGWMFAINGISPSVGAAAAAVSDGDRLLWYVGTPENGYSAPEWDMKEKEDETFISSAEELCILATSPEKWDGSYALSDNIDLSGAEISPIGNSETPFCGSFDGNGFEIYNLTITEGKNSSNIGMFGVIRGARLKNITLKDVNITGGSVVGSVAGRAESDENGISLITDCYVSGSVSAAGNSYARQTDAGGFIGINDSTEKENKVYSSSIDNCTAQVCVTGDTGAADISDAGHIGGFAGLNKGIISDSAALGNVSGGNTTGGFVGSNYGGSIYSSRACGNVQGAYTTGGFAGASGLYSLIENCYSAGNVKALTESGSDYGGFAGSVSGRVKNCISSGTLTAGNSYNGGFAGRLDGTIWSYNDDLRSVSGCYGNSVTSGGRIKAVGSYIGGIHAPTDAAAEEMGVDKETAEKKIEEMINAAKSEERLIREAGKYKTNAAIPATVHENSDITALVARLNANTSADSDIAVGYEAEDAAITADGYGYTLSAKPDRDMKETVILSFTLNNTKYEKPVEVTLHSSAKQADKDTLIKNIAEEYAKSGSDYWKVITAAVYDKLYNSALITEEARLAFAVSAVKEIETSNLDTTLAMNVLALRGLGFNPSDITTADGTKIDAVEKLAASESTGNNGDAYRLLAYNACGYDDSDAAVRRLIASQLDNKGWSNSSDNTIDADSTGAVILGLSSYYNDEQEVKTAVDNAVEYISSLMQTDGNIKSSYKESNYGTNANTSAICALALSALGTDIKTDERFRKNSVSLYDGIMSFASDGGFVYEYADTAVNELATKQAALAVMASENSKSVFDFSDMPKKAVNLMAASGGNGSDQNSGSTAGSGSSTGNGSDRDSGSTTGNGSSAVNGSPAASDSNKLITVTLSLTGDTVHGSNKHEKYLPWLNEKTEIKENSTAKDLIEKVLLSNGYYVKGLENGYISAIVTPEGVSLGELDNGEKSGWMYSVNGSAATVGINDYVLKDGDSVRVYYSDSWDSAGFVDVMSSDWFAEAAVYAAEKGIVKGNEAGEFMPGEKLTRAMAVTILGRLEGIGDEFGTENKFTDVNQSDWFNAHISWAAENGIIMGMGDGMFKPYDSMTREQLSAMLYRYAAFKGMDNMTDNSDLSMFSDSGMISDWAIAPMAWAAGTEIIRGYGDGMAAPLGIATRANFVTMLMRLDNLLK